MYDEWQAEYEAMMNDMAKAQYEEWCRYEFINWKKDNVWKTIKGYCNWYFGRDDYDDKVIVYETETAICCRYLEDKKWLWTAYFKTEQEKDEKIAEREKFERPKN